MLQLAGKYLVIRLRFHQNGKEPLHDTEFNLHGNRLVMNIINPFITQKTKY